MKSTSPMNRTCSSSIAHRGRAVLALLLGFFCVTAVAWADGKAFPPVAVSTEVTMPDQRALLVWSNGVERLAIETRIVGEGTNFAWVVPLPSAPRVEAATVGLFPTLAWLTPPKLVNQTRPIGWWAWSALGVATLLLRVRRKTPLEWMDAIAILSIGAGLMGVAQDDEGGVMAIMAALLAGWTGWRLYRGKPCWSGVSLLLILLLLMAVMVATLLKGQTAGPAPAKAEAVGVDVLDRQVAGVFESTTVSARDAAALETWLKSNGYRLSESARPVIEVYVREGWVFVASRVRREAAFVGPHALHPLVFTFATAKPVYPLRLTGVDNGPLKVELFVLGPARARVKDFEVVDARPVFYYQSDGSDRSSMRRDPGEPVWAQHPGLRSLAGGAPFATRLNATLSPEQMRTDAIVEWDGTTTYQAERYSPRGAGLVCLQAVGGGWLVCLVVVGAVMRLRSWSERQAFRILAAALALALAAGAVGYLWMPVVPVRMESRFERILGPQAGEHVFAMVAQQFKPADPKPSVDSVRAAIRKVQRENPALLSRPMIEEDSPRNYILRAVPGDVEMIYFDDYGQERVYRLGDFRVDAR
jgi:hypothetical protein